MKYSDILAIETDKASGHGRLMMKDGTQKQCSVSAKAFLNRMCLENGSDLSGRIHAYCYLSHFRQKPCVLISEKSGLIFFPTAGIRTDACTWINADAVLTVRQKESGCEIVFETGSALKLDTSKRIIDRQLARVENYRRILDGKESDYEDNEV